MYILGRGLSQSRFKMDSSNPEISGSHGNRPIAWSQPCKHEVLLAKLGRAARGKIMCRTVYFRIFSQIERCPMVGVSESLPETRAETVCACETADQGAASAVGWTVSSCSPARVREVLFTVVHYFP